MKKKVTVSAPGKLMLFGEHAVIYGKPCIVTAVDQRLTLTLEVIIDEVLEIDAPEVGVANYRKDLLSLTTGDVPKGARFIEYAVKNYQEEYGLVTGIKVTTSSEFSSEFGFGSSSAVSVCILKALSEAFNTPLSNQDIFGIAYKTVLDVQAKGSGFDIASAIWGGTLYFVTGGKEIRPLSVKGLPLLVGYTGVKADTVQLVDHVAKLRSQKGEEVDDIFQKIEEIVNKAEQLLIKSEWKEAGSLMNKNQELLEQLDISSDTLNTLISSARENGAYGAKLSGAGGGDCMIALYPENKKEEISSAIKSAGGTILSVQLGAEGVRTEHE